MTSLSRLLAVLSWLPVLGQAGVNLPVSQPMYSGTCSTTTETVFVTVTPLSRVTKASTSIVTTRSTPLSTVGQSTTVTISPPAGWQPAVSTLPNSSNSFGNSDDLKKRWSELEARSVCLVTKTVESTSTLPVTVSTVSTSITTVVLPTQIVKSPASKEYAACSYDNFANFIDIGNGKLDHYLTESGGEALPGTYDRAVDYCAAVMQIPGVGFWQWTPGGGCNVVKAGSSNTCTQSARNYTVNHNSPSSGNLQGRTTGNGYCGRVVKAVPYPGATN